LPLRQRVVGLVVMKKLVQLLGGGLFLLIATMASAQVGNRYTLALNDVISITVFDEPDLTFPRLTITESGEISFPYLGEIDVKGKTALQLQEIIAERLKPDYLVNPKVTVSIVEYRPFFLTGEVAKPGSLSYQPGLTLRQAITLAGGMTERASASRITVISELEAGGAKAAPIKVALDYLIKPGDTITIEESFF
jgi:polysaccharide biosynthesis/export protein VpsN